MNKLWTKKQHFVPRMILKHHTYFRIPMRKPIIYQYDKEKGICRTVDIYDICRKDNLYEFRNEDGSIKESTRNAIENTLSWYESSWDKIFNKILSHQELTETDFAFLYLLFAVQILRLPDVQKVGVQLYKDFTKDIEQRFTDIDIENWVKYASLPTGIIDDNQTILKGFIERLGKKELTIFDSEDVLVINGDFPIAVYLDNFDCDFPVTPHLCLRLKDKRCGKNYGHLSRDDVKKLNDYIINVCNGRFIYSSVPYNQIIKGD